VFRLIQQREADRDVAGATMANALLNAPDRGQFDLSSIQVVNLGGAASSPELIERLEKTFGWEAKPATG